MIKGYKQTFNDGLATFYKHKPQAKKGTYQNPDALTDLTKVAEFHYGESTATYRDSELMEGHDVSDTIKIKVNNSKVEIKPDMYATIKSFRTGREEFCRVYNVSPNYNTDCLFIYMEEVRHGGYR